MFFWCLYFDVIKEFDTLLIKREFLFLSTAVEGQLFVCMFVYITFRDVIKRVTFELW